MTASALSISLAQLGQRGVRSSVVTPYGLPSSSRSSSAAAALAGLGLTAGRRPGTLSPPPAAGLGRAAPPAARAATKTSPHALQRTFLPSTASGALLSLPQPGQEMGIEPAIDGLRSGSAPGR